MDYEVFLMSRVHEEWERRNDAEAARWAKVQQVTSVVTGALEVERREKRMGAALEAAPVVHVADHELLAAFEGLDPAEVFRTSQARLVAGEGPGFRLPEVPGVSVEPLTTEFGRKTVIDQASCNVDASCLKGDCPAFITVKPGRRTAGAGTVAPAAAPVAVSTTFQRQAASHCHAKTDACGRSAAQ